ncbi:MAG: thiamine pyrophosphate-binding protein [Hyphomicrobiales bacterium]
MALSAMDVSNKRIRPMRGADIIAKKLADAGCKTAFGIPGGEVLTVLDGLREADINFVLVKHENAGGFMAEGAWHATGAPAILVATIGPGVANAVNVIANAMQDRVPMIFITGCVDGAEAETYTHQVFDHQQMLRPIVKASFRANEGAIGVMMDKAISIATSGQPGPVHIDLPINVAQSESETEYTPLASLPKQGLPAAGLIFEVQGRIAAAKKPIVIAGVDALNEGADVSHFCKTLNIPMIATYKAKGMLDERDPLSLGGGGLSPKADGVLLPLIEEADLVLLLGYDPIEMRVGWRNPWPAEKAVEITSSLRTHGMHTAGTTLMGDVAATTASLANADGGKYWVDGEVAKARATLKEMFAAGGGDFGPEHVFATLREAAPENTVITADSGAHRILVSQMWECINPRTMLQSSALCTMGCAVPLAAGYKYESPDTPTIAFVGDAGFEMMMGDLSTLRDMKTPVIICVLVDESLGLIEIKQRAMQLPNNGVDFSGTDFPKVAEGFGGHGVWIDDVATLRTEFEAALERDTFTVLCPRIGRQAYNGKF